MSTMTNISVADEQRDSRSLDTIYEGLFGVGAVHNCLTRGDQRYGMNDWVKPFNTKEKSLIDEISKHIAVMPSETTIHKVWKLQGSRRLDTLKISGNLMLGIDLFDVIDLTDKSKVIMISMKNGRPSSGKYILKNEIIEINPKCCLRVVDLSKDSLTLNLILNFEVKDVSAKGEAFEMTFVELKHIN